MRSVQVNQLEQKAVKTLVRLTKKLLAKELSGFGDCGYCSVSTAGNQSLSRIKHDKTCLLFQLRTTIKEVQG